MLPSTMVGWASRVETWCFTFSKGRDCLYCSVSTGAGASGMFRGFSYGQLLDNGVGSEDRGGLEGEHGLLAL